MKKDLIQAGYGLGAFGIIMLMAWWFKEPDFSVEREQIAIEREQLAKEKEQLAKEKTQLTVERVQFEIEQLRKEPLVKSEIRFVPIYTPAYTPIRLVYPSVYQPIIVRPRVSFIGGKFIRRI